MDPTCCCHLRVVPAYLVQSASTRREYAGFVAAFNERVPYNVARRYGIDFVGICVFKRNKANTRANKALQVTRRRWAKCRLHGNDSYCIHESSG